MFFLLRRLAIGLCLALLCVFAPGAYAAECGDSVPCDCGDSVGASTTLTADIDGCSRTGREVEIKKSDGVKPVGNVIDLPTTGLGVVVR
ncbi:MAG: hypothetical protein P8R42_21235 [Candidatus Binatia bacterium]|nr:hypothetical protein [Candidatus Binatia bacterium]